MNEKIVCLYHTACDALVQYINLAEFQREVGKAYLGHFVIEFNLLYNLQWFYIVPSARMWCLRVFSMERNIACELDVQTGTMQRVR